MSDLLNSASLVLIPSGYKEDIVYSAVPTDGSGDLSFTRASNGTRINSAGLVEVCPWNLLQQSETFDNAYWNLYQATITSNTTTAPNGTTTADTLNSGSGFSGVVYTSAIFSAGDILTLSIYAKANTSSILQLGTTDGTDRSANFNLSTGVVVSSVGVTASIESVGNGWYRCSVSRTMLNPANFFVVEGTGSLSLFIWGAQTNVGVSAKPYFPTTDRLNVPRLTYQNGGGGCPSLLLEKQSTNLAFPSEDLTAWTSGGMTNTANITTSPDGTQNADKSTIGSTTRYYDVVTNSITTVNGTIYTTSFFAKKGTGIEAIYFYQGDGGRAAKWNLNNGVYIGYAPADGYNAFTSQTSENLGNGWYRFTATYTASSTGGNLTIGISTNTNNSITQISGNGTDFVYVWGLQYEASSYPTSYINTTSASATRVADVCSKSGIGTLIGGTSGTVFFDIKTNPTLSSANYKQFCYYVTSGSSQSYMYLDGANKITTNATWGSLFYNTAFQPNTRYKVALVFAPNDFALYVNGVSVATASSGTPNDNVNLQIGQFNGSEMCEFVFNQYTHFPSRLTNAELASLTTI